MTGNALSDGAGGRQGRVPLRRAARPLGARTRAAVLAAAALLVACTLPAPQAPGAAAPAGPTTPGAAAPSGAGAVDLVAVIDGDTIDVATAAGVERVRVLGINAPERDECLGAESTRVLEELLRGAELGLEGAEGRDRYGRVLAFVRADGRDAGRELLASGHAVASSSGPRSADYQAAEADARRAGGGLWASAACGPPSVAPGSLRVRSIEAAPRGDPLQGEWVEFVNDGPGAVELAGFVLRDESSSNRYVVPAGTVLGPGAALRVVSGCGRDQEGLLHWCASTPVWNNGGDSVLLLDGHGNVAAWLRY